MPSYQLPKIQTYSEIKSNLLRPSLTSTYNVYFNANAILKSGSDDRTKFFRDRGFIQGDPADLLTISCCEASLPGSSLATHEINNDHTGVTERHVYRRLYDDRSSFTFYVDSNYQVLKFFETWMSWIVGEEKYNEQEKREYCYRVKYPNDYRVDMFIQKYERDYGKAKSKNFEYTFIDAYPIDISSMPMSYDSSNLLKCTVSFVYTRYFMGDIIESPLIESKPNTTSNPNVDRSTRLQQSLPDIARYSQ
jgi:hypothetical protein